MSIPRTWPALSALDDALWRQRRLAERLLYALTAARLLLEADLDMLLPHAAGDAQDAIDALHTIDAQVRRAQARAAREVTTAAGVTSLAALADVAPEPWATILGNHAAALRSLAAEVADAMSADRDLARQALQRVHHELAVVQPEHRPGMVAR